MVNNGNTSVLKVSFESNAKSYFSFRFLLVFKNWFSIFKKLFDHLVGLSQWSLIKILLDQVVWDRMELT